MVVGFNHNFRYRGELYHIQTEDGGLKSPHIITLLYKGGTILSSKKTSYADIIRVDNLEQVVEELMKEQHREMLRRLKEGELDSLLAARPPAQAPSAAHAGNSGAPPRPPVASPARPQASPAAPRPVAPAEASLDEIILSYLVGKDPED